MTAAARQRRRREREKAHLRVFRLACDENVVAAVLIHEGRISPRDALDFDALQAALESRLTEQLFPVTRDFLPPATAATLRAPNQRTTDAPTEAQPAAPTKSGRRNRQL
jgi:hypothetical protein